VDRVKGDVEFKKKRKLGVLEQRSKENNEVGGFSAGTRTYSPSLFE
jgi:hypothetical protein